MQVALRFAYDGRFPGYARQPEGGTVEDLLMQALEAEGFVAGSWRSGSRTDRGVCALGNVATCVLERPHLRGIIPSTQARLPAGIWLTGAAEVRPDFDPRRAAWREYSYTAPARGEALELLQEACQAFVGTHDMRAFCRMEEGRPPERTVVACSVEPDAGWWRFRVRGHSFLWNQVRRMVDAALQVGAGRASVQDIQQSLRDGRPHPSFGLAPAGGLMLERVVFDPEPAWAADAGTLWWRQLDGAAQEARVRARLMEALGRTAQ